MVYLVKGDKVVLEAFAIKQNSQFCERGNGVNETVQDLYDSEFTIHAQFVENGHIQIGLFLLQEKEDMTSQVVDFKREFEHGCLKIEAYLSNFDEALT